MSVLLGRLYALREQLDVVIESVEGTQKPPVVDQACEHPPESRKYDGGTMSAGAGFTCQQCNTVVKSTEQILGRIVQPNTSEGA